MLLLLFSVLLFDLGDLFLDLELLTFRKDLMATQREYKKKKAQKKAQRMKTMEEERETEKNKWLNFNTKVPYRIMTFD